MTPKEEIITAEFLATLEELAIKPRYDLRLLMDGQIHRFSTDEDIGGEKSGAYYIHSDGWPNWGVMDFRKHDEMQKFKLSRERMPEQWDGNTQASQQKQNEREQESEEARRRAYNEYSRADSKMANFHPYIYKKRVSGITQKIRVVTSETHKHSDLCKIGDLLIPLVNAATRKFQTPACLPVRPLPPSKLKRRRELAPRNFRTASEKFFRHIQDRCLNFDTTNQSAY